MAALAVGVSVIAVRSLMAQTPAPVNRAFHDFNERVSQYVDLHHAVVASLGPEAISPDPPRRLEQKRALAAAVRDARPSTEAGGVFTPEIAELFRARVAAAIRETGFDLAAAFREFEAQFEEDGLISLPDLEINGEFPSFVGTAVWARLLWRLPPLPPEVEYRMFAGDLVLIDVRVGMVVDILRELVPAPETPAPRVGTPCDVHPDLPACWS
jgi:hypothetical protein